MSNAKPYYLKSRDCWCINVFIDGRKVRRKLADSKKEAFDIWKASLRSRRETAVGNPLFITIATMWLKRQVQRFKDGEVSNQWLIRVSRTVAAFDAAHPSICCMDITPAKLYEWLDGKSANYRRTEFTGLSQCLRWAVKNDHILKHPLAAIEMPSTQSRERLLTRADHLKLCKASNKVFRPLMRMAWIVGARPGELRNLKWEQIADDFSRAVLSEHKTAKKTEKPRVIYFPARAQASLKRRKSRRKTDSPFVYLNHRKKPWTKNAVVIRMRRLKEVTGLEAVAYDYRHAWITRALENGIEIAVVAELAGTSPTMVARVYSKLGKKNDLLSKAASRIKDL